ncbi:MAG TPA: HD domain-containing protein [Anaerolineales bacterium]|nr:HD domain-containing protein [Anaerolineales bacterium]HNA89731.1 HD domain-containing protein [Anaerolineales bacterium]HNB35256.1 HD domain-containing protein [Anaerolineales bacterium]HNC08198.1 HD domain-containing protein [Anaerolineales bacterium]HNH27261.1 HD domain-containing protein [Anaerolineales bacterium]
MDDATGIIFKALRFSAEKHSEQRRKDAKSSPYINHPIQVAETLWSIGGVRDANLLAAAILHDTIEDTNTTPAEIQTLFGEDVLSLVLEVTDDKSLPKDVRKKMQIENASHKSPRAKLLKLADKLCNIYDITHIPPTTWPLKRKQDYLLWSEKVVHGLRGTNKELEARYDEVLQEGKHLLKMG